VDAERGTLAPGKVADLLIVDADPSADIRNTPPDSLRDQGRRIVSMRAAGAR